LKPVAAIRNLLKQVGGVGIVGIVNVLQHVSRIRLRFQPQVLVPRNLAHIILHRLPGIRQDQPRLVQRIAAKHAAHGIGDELAHRVGQEQRLVFGVGFAGAVAVVRIAGERDLVQRHVGREFVLQAVGVDEDAVVLFLQPLHLQRHRLPVGAQAGVGGWPAWLAVLGPQQRQGGEVPGGFIGIPVA
jgi:hypothetical protein